MKGTRSLRIYHWAFSPPVLLIFNELSENSLCIESHWLGNAKGPFDQQIQHFLLVLEGFYSWKLQKILLIMAPKLSFQLTPGLETWGVRVLPSHSPVELRRIREPGLASNCHPGSINPVGFTLIHFSAWEIPKQGRVNLPSPAVRPHYEDTCWTCF